MHCFVGLTHVYWAWNISSCYSILWAMRDLFEIVFVISACMGLNNGIEQWAFITPFLLPISIPISISVSISCFSIGPESPIYKYNVLVIVRAHCKFNLTTAIMTYWNIEQFLKDVRTVRSHNASAALHRPNLPPRRPVFTVRACTKEGHYSLVKNVRGGTIFTSE